jgi:hypothetical protein
MSALDLTIDSLRSSTIRTIATGGDGTRMVDGILTNEADDGNNLVGGILRLIERINAWGSGFSGFLLKTAGRFLWGGFTGLMSQIQSALLYLWSFNYNATDAEIDQQFANYMSTIGGLLGGTVGNAAGWLFCGIGAGLVIARFNKLLAVRVLKEVGEEALEEVIANLRNLVMQGFQMYWRWEMMQKFKMARRTIKTMFRDPNGAVSRAFQALGGDPSRIQQWGEQGGKPWSFAIAHDAWIEAIPPGFQQNFTEELIEEFFDSCSEAFYVVAGAADQYMLEQKLQKGEIFGQEEILEISPNRDIPEEKIILAGPQELIKPVLVQTLVQHQLLDERDLGMWVGEPMREALIAPPISIQMRIVLSDMLGVLNKRKRVQITIPDVDRARIDWSRLKQALGGANGYMWGPYRCNARLSGGNQIQVYAATEQEGVERINELAYFCNQEIIGITAVRELREGRRRTIDALYKAPTRIYPHSFTIVNQQRVLNEESGQAQLSGIYKSKRASLIPLWEDSQPDDFAEVLQELFHVPGAND